MTKRLELYKCNVCGNLVEVVLAGYGELVCCGKPMELLVPKTNEPEMGEKHIPVFATNDRGELEVRVGSTLHPMVDEHFIQFIQTVSDDEKYIERRYLTPEDLPIMYLGENSEADKALEYCNIHGLWANE